ncbi:MAG: hypothetical protein JWQ78_1381, partial [Sediminibacterium sp.]|nr:hypothetical protein [Sediminibacterium sp.]
MPIGVNPKPHQGKSWVNENTVPTELDFFLFQADPSLKAGAILSANNSKGAPPHRGESL